MKRLITIVLAFLFIASGTMSGQETVGAEKLLKKDVLMKCEKKRISVSLDLQFIEVLSPSSFNGGFF